MSEEEIIKVKIEKLKKKIEELQKVNLELTRSAAVLVKENFKLKEKLDIIKKKK